MARRMIVVGGGVLGTMHALLARRAGWEVQQFESDPGARTASVRNFGMIWVSGRAPGAELEAALRARELWGDIAREVPAIGLRPIGSLTLVTDEAQVAVLRQVCDRDDAAARGVDLLGVDDTRRRNPLLRGEFRAALWCPLDAVVEPAAVLPAVRAHLAASSGYRWCPGRTVTDVRSGIVVDHTGVAHTADAVVICPGARTDGIVAELMHGAPVRRVRLQMAATENLGAALPTMLADEDSLRYYPAYDVPARTDLPPADPLVAAWGMQLLVAPRLSGELTIGDTHAYDEPFAVGLDERPYEHLSQRLGALLGRPAPRLHRRWGGVYSQCLDGSALCHRGRPADGVVLVTGPGGRGMTLAPFLAGQTLQEIA